MVVGILDLKVLGQELQLIKDFLGLLAVSESLLGLKFLDEFEDWAFGLGIGSYLCLAQVA